MVTILFQLFIVLFLIFMNGFFVAAEFACVKIRPSRLEMLIQEGNRRAGYAKALTDHLDASLSVTQLGITLASLGLGWVGEPFVAKLILPLTGLMGIDPTFGHTLALVLGFAIITAMHIILGELTPKSMAIQHVESIMLAVALPMLIFARVMYPFVWLLNHAANFIIACLGMKNKGEGEDAHTEEEIRLLMEESHKQGLIDDTEVDFVDNVFDFADMTVREIMVPRTDMVCLYLENTWQENMNVIMDEQLTRYPICREDKDHIIGFLHVKDVMRAVWSNRLEDDKRTGNRQPFGRNFSLRSFARKVLVVPESMDVSLLLKTMQQRKSQLAVVVDEYGGTAGMVTIEDIVEEIVGDIQDEFDEERPMAEPRGERIYSVDAKLLLDELEDILDIAIEDEAVDSVGGWLNDQLGGDPQVGQMAAFDGNIFYVEETDGARIIRVLVCVARE